jgi:PAS domain S-box-containing protein/putative nucleotidyltransferase with HDIG domain
MDIPVEELRILLLEDVPSDAALEEGTLRDAGLVFTLLRVAKREAFERALDEFKPHIVLADYRLPAYNGHDALVYIRRTHPWVPVIIVTGSLGDEAAVELLKEGARDYVLKGHLARLVPAIKRAISEERSIRNRKLAEGKYQALFNEAMDGIALIDCESGQVLDCNPEFARQCGRAPEQIKGISSWELLPTAMREEGQRKFLDIKESGSGRSDEFEFMGPNGELVPIEFTAKRLHVQDKCFIQTISRDITERQHAEDRLRRINRTLRTLSAGNIALVKAVDDVQLLDAVCRVIVEKGEYRMAWVGYVENDAKRVVPMACRGLGKSALARLQLGWEDAANEGSVAKVVRTATLHICRDIQTGSDCESYRELAAEQGWNANLTVPLWDGMRVFGVLSIFSSDPEAFGQDEVALLSELGGDLAYGINALKIRAERDEAMEKSHRYQAQLRENLEETIQAVAATVEMRDPYTAGHEKRVAELSVAIGQELGMTQAQLDGLRIAANVHDIGKVKVPAEILSKPTALDDLAFSMIKLHPESGYEILKGIHFPWPVADIVRQHHERLDGSGYPRGLEDGEILLEAQILAIADVVESIVSHRPYRPALGLEAGLQEITSKRGRCYNADAVDACIRLFREKGYVLPGTGKEGMR